MEYREEETKFILYVQDGKNARNLSINYIETLFPEQKIYRGPLIIISDP